MKYETPVEYGLFYSSFMILLGLIGLAVGGKFIVDGAVVFAQMAHVSEAFIGLTIVAIGTSLPEMAASVVAARKGTTDMAVGNVIGSNIFNLLWVLGMSSIISPIGFNSALNIDVLLLIVATILLLFLIFIGRKNILEKKEGITLIAIFVTYMIYIIIRG